MEAGQAQDPQESQRDAAITNNNSKDVWLRSRVLGVRAGRATNQVSKMKQNRGRREFPTSGLHILHYQYHAEFCFSAGHARVRFTRLS